jgi:hypothetical protein
MMYNIGQNILLIYFNKYNILIFILNNIKLYIYIYIYIYIYKPMVTYIAIIYYDFFKMRI